MSRTTGNPRMSQNMSTRTFHDIYHFLPLLSGHLWWYFLQGATVLRDVPLLQGYHHLMLHATVLLATSRRRRYNGVCKVMLLDVFSQLRTMYQCHQSSVCLGFSKNIVSFFHEHLRFQWNLACTEVKRQTDLMKTVVYSWLFLALLTTNALFPGSNLSSWLSSQVMFPPR